MQFDIILMDPPWNFSDALTMASTKRSAKSNYDTMSNQELLDLDIKSLASQDGCLLALWVPSSLIELGIQCANKYGFTIKQTYVWSKTKQDPFKNTLKQIKSHYVNSKDKKEFISNIKSTLLDLNLNLNTELSQFFMGRLFRQSHEICLIAINNNGIYKKLKNKSQRSVCFETNLKHSKKPEHLQDSLDKMFPNAKALELFARRDRSGYICAGNEAPLTPSEDIRVSIEKLKRLTDIDYNLILNETDLKEKANKWLEI